MQSTSPRFQYNWIDIRKSIRTGAVFAVAAFLTYIINQYSSAIVSSVSLKYAFLSPFLAFALEFLRRWATDHSVQSN